jgi:hypothetical protein
VKCFRVPIAGSTLYPTKPEQAEERLFTEPVFRALRSENIEQCFALEPRGVSAERNVDVWLTEVSVPLRYLVLENEVLRNVFQVRSDTTL